MKVDLLLMGRNRRVALDKSSSLYGLSMESDDIARYQLNRFNSVWKQALRTLEFYRQWQSKHGLPRQLTSLEDLHQFPVLTKADLSASSDLVFAEHVGKSTYTTGGSTSEPTILPRGRGENIPIYADNAVGRLWWGIRPLDKRVLVWGHSHLFGTGRTQLLRQMDRRFRDRLTRTTRLNGYLTENGEVEIQLAELARSGANHVVGYSSALVRLAHAAKGEAVRLRSELKAVIATADTLTEADANLLAEVFRCPVVLEYGAAETGVLAVSRNETWNLQVLWGSQILLQHPSAGVLVTTLNPRHFPLINYQLGDSMEVKTSTSSGTAITLTRVDGRISDVLRLATYNSGRIREVWAVHLTQIIKAFGGVLAVQYEQLSDGRGVVHAKLAEDSDQVRGKISGYLKSTLARELPDIDPNSLVWEFDKEHQKTISGKHRVMRVS